MRHRIAKLSVRTKSGGMEATKEASKLEFPNQYVAIVATAAIVTGKKIIHTPINTTNVAFVFANNPNLGTTLSKSLSS